jgi:hypothetical protein
VPVSAPPEKPQFPSNIDWQRPSSQESGVEATRFNPFQKSNTPNGEQNGGGTLPRKMKEPPTSALFPRAPPDLAIFLAAAPNQTLTHSQSFRQDFSFRSTGNLLIFLKLFFGA